MNDEKIQCACYTAVQIGTCTEHCDRIETNMPSLTIAGKINHVIKLSGVDTNLISDGYHTFGELYEHRIRLFITLCQTLDKLNHVYNGCDHYVWHHLENESDEWFLMGINIATGHQITYHLPVKYLDEVKSFADSRIIKPKFDGHTSADVLERLKNL